MSAGDIVVYALDALLIVFAVTSSRRARRPRVLLRCSACGDECTAWLSPRRLRSWATIAKWAPWAVFVLIVVFPQSNHLPPLAAWALIMGYAIVYGWAERRLYHAWWMWRHPARCEGGRGHLVPEASS